MVEAPEKIYADRGPRGGWMFREDRMPDTEAEYLRSDIAERQIAELRAERDKWREAFSEMHRQTMAAETENARLRALPLKDEVERVVKLLSCLDLDHSTEHDDLILETCVKDARALLSRLRAGEQDGSE